MPMHQIVKYVIILYAFISCDVFAQVDDAFLTRFLIDNELVDVNRIESYASKDFSGLWTATPNHLVFGMIGADHQRIRIALTSIARVPDSPREYQVLGKTKVENKVSELRGTIRIDSVQEVKRFQYGVDDMYRDSSIVDQGVVFASCAFFGSGAQDRSGKFNGMLITKWYLNAAGELKYDDLQLMADSYMNNAFVGFWTPDGPGDPEVCNWGDYRIPRSAQDFDIGAGDFSPSEKYYPYGWEIYQKAWLYGDKEAQKEEMAAWWE